MNISNISRFSLVSRELWLRSKTNFNYSDYVSASKTKMNHQKFRILIQNSFFWHEHEHSWKMLRLRTLFVEIFGDSAGLKLLQPGIRSVRLWRVSIDVCFNACISASIRSSNRANCV